MFDGGLIVEFDWSDIAVGVGQQGGSLGREVVNVKRALGFSHRVGLRPSYRDLCRRDWHALIRLVRVLASIISTQHSQRFLPS